MDLKVTPELIEAAKQLKRNPLLGMLLDGLKADQLLAWEDSITPEKREQCWFMVRATESIKTYVTDRTDELAGQSAGVKQTG